MNGVGYDRNFHWSGLLDRADKGIGIEHNEEAIDAFVDEFDKEGNQGRCEVANGNHRALDFDCNWRRLDFVLGCWD
jgi:rhamnogalacturonyl hydrolase YesR